MNKRGIIITYVLVFGAIFLLLLSGLLGFILLQLRQSAQRLAWNQSLHIAEAGIHYYRWCLNNQVEGNCLLEKEYLDPAGNPLGKFSLQIITEEVCGQILTREIISTGWTYRFPGVQRRVGIIYSKESVAKYAYLINDHVWAGADREIRGLYHSNRGIRMDGINYSLVTSATQEWICTRSFGCPPCPEVCYIDPEGNCVCPGVFTTANGNEDLFDWPVPSFDFAGITVDLAQIRNLSQTQPGAVYLPPSQDIDPEAKGYHLIFQPEGTVEVWLITELDQVLAYSLEEGWFYESSIIEGKYLYQTISLGPTCPLIFVEDNLWVEGTIKGRVTLVSANLIDPNLDTSVFLTDNIDYTVLDGSDGLTLIGERNVLIGPDSPDYMTLRGIFVAQKGHFGRNLYIGGGTVNRWGELLVIHGSIISNGRVGTAWFNLAGWVVSGYRKRETYIDPNLIYNPPIFTPFVSEELKLFHWREIE